MDSILYEGDNGGRVQTESWYSTVEKREVSWNDVFLTYGCWAEDAVRSALLAPEMAS
nr:hypothetical protein [Clostridia bacterium]